MQSPIPNILRLLVFNALQYFQQMTLPFTLIWYICLEIQIVRAGIIHLSPPYTFLFVTCSEPFKLQSGMNPAIFLLLPIVLANFGL